MSTNSYLGGSTLINLRQWQNTIEPWADNPSPATASNNITVKIKTGPISSEADEITFRKFISDKKHKIEYTLARPIREIKDHEDFLKYFLYSSIQWCHKNNLPLYVLITASFSGASNQISVKNKHAVKKSLRNILKNMFSGLNLKIDKNKYTIYRHEKAKPEELETLLEFLNLIIEGKWDECNEITQYGSP